MADSSSSSRTLVVARCRPCSEEKAWRLNGNSIQNAVTDKQFVVDVLLKDTASHQESFQLSLCDLLPAATVGNSYTVVAYGLPGSGKTHTLFGTTGQSRVSPVARGVIARCGEQLLRLVTDGEQQAVSKLTATFCHVFGDGRVADLLDTKKRSLSVVSGSGDSYHIQGASEQPITSLQQVVRMVEKGSLMRNATGCLRQTAGERRFTVRQSSADQHHYRAHCSHAVFQYTLDHLPTDPAAASPSSQHVYSSVITIVDLAGQSVQDYYTGHFTSDTGITALHTTLQELKQGNTHTATSACSSTSLTKLLYSGILGNSRTVLLLTLALESDLVALTEKCLEIGNELRVYTVASSVDPDVSMAATGQTRLERSLAEQKCLKQRIAEQNGIDSIDSWETVNDTAVTINEQLIDQLSEESLEILSKLRTVEDQLLYRPSIRLPYQQDAKAKGLGIPALMLSPKHHQGSISIKRPSSLKLSTAPVVRTTPKPRGTSTPYQPVQQQQQQQQQQQYDTSSDDSSSRDSSDIEMHNSLPPLRDIPHIKLATPINSPLTPVGDNDTFSGLHAATRRCLTKEGVPGTQQHQQELKGTTNQPPGCTPSADPWPAGHTITSSTAGTLYVSSYNGQHQPPASRERMAPAFTSTPKKGKKQPINRRPYPGRQINARQPMAAIPVSAPVHVVASSSTSDTSSSSTLSSDSAPCAVESSEMFNQGVQVTHVPALPSTHKRMLPTLPPVHGMTGREYGHHSLPKAPPIPAVAASQLNDEAFTRALPSYAQANRPPQYPYHEEQSDADLLRDETVTVMAEASQHLSQQEIHVAAMEGVKLAHLRSLVLQCGVDHRDTGGRTPLMYAVLGNQPRICEELLNMEANVNASDYNDNTPIIWASFLARYEVMKILLRYRCDILVADSNGRSALHWAMKSPLTHCIKLLCKHLIVGVENRLDNDGLSPLHWAVMCEQVEHLRCYLKVPSVDVSIQDNKGRTPLVYAVLNYSPQCVKAILDCCESAVNHRDSKGRAALHFACAESSADCVRALLACRKCNINCTDHRAATPLHWAAAANQPGIVQLLLRRGADRTSTDEADMTAEAHARQRGHYECVKILEEYGIRRQPSVWSVASQFTPQPATPPELDQYGHKLMKRPKAMQRLFSGGTVDRLPADGHSHSDGEQTRQLREERTDKLEEEEEEEEEQQQQRPRVNHSRVRRWLLCGLCTASCMLTVTTQ